MQCHQHTKEFQRGCFFLCAYRSNTEAFDCADLEGRVKRERADEYEQYNFETGIKPLIQKALGVQCLREDRETETEFVTISYWESVEAMSRFTGGDPTKIHHLPRDPEFLVEVPKSVQILRIYQSHGRIG